MGADRQRAGDPERAGRPARERAGDRADAAELAAGQAADLFVAEEILGPVGNPAELAARAARAAERALQLGEDPVEGATATTTEALKRLVEAVPGAGRTADALLDHLTEKITETHAVCSLLLFAGRSGDRKPASGMQMPLP